MTALFSTLLFILNTLNVIVIAHVIMSWLLNFGIIDRNNRYVLSIWHTLESLLDPIYSRIRNFLPAMAIDLSPIIVLVIIYFFRVFIISDLGPMLA